MAFETVFVSFFPIQNSTHFSKADRGEKRGRPFSPPPRRRRGKEEGNYPPFHGGVEKKRAGFRQTVEKRGGTWYNGSAR